MARSSTKDRDSGVDTEPEFGRLADPPFDASRFRDTADLPDDTGYADDPVLSAESSGRVRPVRRARFGVTVLCVLLAEVVLIGAGVNQGVSKHLAAYAADHPVALLGRFVRSLLVLRWSFTAQNGRTDLWHTELITVGLVLLLGIVLVPLIVHGPVSWLRAFVGTWFTVTVGVVVATVGAIVLSDLEESRDLADYVVPGTPGTGLSVSTRIGDAAFGVITGYAFVAGLALGLVVALVTATVVIAMRRTDPIPVAAVPAASNRVPDVPEPFFGDEGAAERRAAYRDTSYPPPVATPSSDTVRYPGRYAESDRYAESETAAYARPSSPRSGIAGAGAAAAGSTTELPVVDEPAAAEATDDREASGARASTQAWPAQPSGERPSDDATAEADAEPDAERTAAFPVPPDDEALPDHPDHHDD